MSDVSDFWHMQRDFCRGAYKAPVYMLPGLHMVLQGSCSDEPPMFAWLTVHGFADLDGVMPTHVQDLLPIPEQLTGSAFCIAAMQAHSFFRC